MFEYYGPAEFLEQNGETGYLHNALRRQNPFTRRLTFIFLWYFGHSSRVWDFSGSLLSCGFLQNLVLHVPGPVATPLGSISLFPTYLFRRFLGTSHKKLTTKMSSCCLEKSMHCYIIHMTAQV